MDFEKFAGGVKTSESFWFAMFHFQEVRDMATEKSLAVLLVEDNPTDKLRIEKALSQAGDFPLRSGTRLGEALRLLSEERFDVVLLNLGLPDSQGLETLRRLRERHSNVAIIVLTGEDDEELALQALHAGAADYLVKNQADSWQLRRAILCAVERAKIPEALRQSEERLRRMVNVDGVGILTFDETETLVDANDAFLEMMGYSRAEIDAKSLTWRTLTPPEFIAVSEQQLLALQQTGRIGPYEKEYLRKDGSRCWMVFAGASLGDGTVIEYCIDISDRKQAEKRLAASERLLHELADAMPQFVWAARPNGYADYYNQRWIEYTGLSRDAAAGENWKTILHPDDVQHVTDSWLEVLRTGQPLESEARFKSHTTGEYRWHLIRAVPLRDEANQIVRWIGTCTDIEDLKQAEEELRHRSQLAQLVADIGSACAAGGELDKTLQSCTEALVRHLDAAFARIWTLNEGEAVLELRASAGMYTHRDGPHSRVPVGQYKIGLIAEERQPHLTNSVVGDPRVNDQAWAKREGMVAFAGYPLLADDRVVGVMAVFARHPLTDFVLRAMASIADVLAIGIERLKTEQSLRSSEARKSAILETALDCVIAMDHEGKIVEFNPAAEKTFGYSRAEVVGQELLRFIIPPSLRERHRKGLAHYLATGEGPVLGKRLELRALRADGTEFPVEIAITRIPTEGPPLFTAYLRDITERKQAEEDLRLRDRAIQAVSEGILIIDPVQPDAPIIFASPSFEKITGYSAAEALGRNCRFLQGPDSDKNSAVQLEEAIHSGRRCSVEILNYRKDGTPFWNAMSISPIRNDRGELTHFVVVQADVTARRSLEEQARQSQKMEAIGSLAGGVAHDFNNLLTVINGYCELIPAQLPDESPVRGLVREIGQAGERAASLTRQLLAFSRKQVLEPKVLNLNAVVTDTARMLKRLIGEDIDLATALNPTVGVVKADPGQIEQVLINLAVNARDAMHQGGKLTIETANAELDEAYTQAFPDLRPGSYVMLTLSDTGVGMDEQTKSRIFEPFFTTKGVGQGTGLGLATVFGIVKQSGGHVAVSSEPGHGATFKVYLPRVEEHVSASKSHPDSKVVPQGNETILLVEDEPALLALARRILQNQGYTVLEASRGKEALEIGEQHHGRIHLLVTDVVMPGMSGRQVAECLTAQRPGIKVLFLSGYTDDAVVRHGIFQAETAFLQKPYSPTTFAQKVRDVLDQTDRTAGGVG